MAETMETEMDFSDGEQTNASLVALYGNSAIRLQKHEQLPGYIFMCNGRTKPDCFRYRVFGIPRGGKNVVESIKPGMKLFLYDFEKKLLYGVYEATVGGKLDIEPDAFERKYPAQVGFRIVENCYPLPETTFKTAIYENYKGGKFKQELAPHQVGSLLSLFRSFAAPQLDALPHRFASRASASRELSFEERFIAATQLKKASSVLDPLSRSHLHQSYSRQDGYTTPMRETPSHSNLEHSYLPAESRQQRLLGDPSRSSIQDPQLKYLTILSNIRRYGSAPEPLASENEYHPAMPSEKDQFASPYSDKKYYLSTLPGNEHSSASAAKESVYRDELYTSAASQKEGEANQQHEILAGTYYHPEASTVSMQAVNAVQSHTATAGYTTLAHAEAPQQAAGAIDYANQPQSHYATHSQPGSVGESTESYAGAVSYQPQQHYAVTGQTTQLYAGGPGYTQQPHETVYAQQTYSAATGYTQQNHAASTVYAQQPQDAATGYAQQPQDAATVYAQQPQDAATVYAQQLHDAAAGYAQQTLDAAAGYAQQPYGQAVGYTTQPQAQAPGYTTQYGAQAVGYTPQYSAQYTTQSQAYPGGYAPQYGTQAGAYSQQAVAQGSMPGAPRATDWNAASQAYAATGDWNQSYYHHTADTTATYNQTS